MARHTRPLCFAERKPQWAEGGEAGKILDLGWLEQGQGAWILSLGQWATPDMPVILLGKVGRHGQGWQEMKPQEDRREVPQRAKHSAVP